MSESTDLTRVVEKKEQEIEQLKTQLSAWQRASEVPVGANGIQVSNAAQLRSYAIVAVEGEMVPKGMTVKQVFAAMAFGMSIGLTPLYAAQTVAVVNGRPFVWGDGFLAILYASGQLEDIHEWWNENERAAYCEMKRVGRPRKVVRSFSMDDAQDAGLLDKKSPWQTYPRRMAQMRARRLAGRDLFADICGGLQFREDYQEAVRIERERVKDVDVEVSDPNSAPLPMATPEAAEERHTADDEAALREALGIDEENPTQWGEVAEEAMRDTEEDVDDEPEGEQ